MLIGGKLGDNRLMENTNTTSPTPGPARLSIHVVVPVPMLKRIDRLVGQRCADRSEAVRTLLAAALDALEERAGRSP
jgi:hypothetical protein